MDTLTLINALIERAEWWHDETGFVMRDGDMSEDIRVIENEYGIFRPAEHSCPNMSDNGTDVRAWFLLLIAADLETGLEHEQY